MMSLSHHNREEETLLDYFRQMLSEEEAVMDASGEAPAVKAALPESPAVEPDARGDLPVTGPEPELQPAPEVKVRKRRTKKSEVKEEKGEWVIHPQVEHITGDDILAANYALAATKGSPSEAVLLMPDIDDTTMELIARMNSRQIREIVEAHPTTITNIDAKYATGRWDEIA